MALTQAQKDAIQRQLKKNIAKRAATQKTKISDSEARKASSTMNKRAGGSPSFTLKDRTLLTKSELDALGRTSKANAEQEKKIQKQRKFAKGEGKLPMKERVGTKAEYKQLGKEIQTRKQLIAYGKAARAAQAERAKNPKATPAKAAPAAKATPEKAAKPVAAKKTTAKKTTPAKKTAATPKAKTPVAPKAPKASKPKAPKAAKAPKINTTPTVETPATQPTKAKKTSKPKSPAKPKLQTLEQAKASAPKPKATGLQTLEEARAKAPRPKGVLVDQPAQKPGSVQRIVNTEAPAKAPSKAASKVAEAKKAAKSSTIGRAAKAASKTPIVQAAAKSKAAKVLKVGGKLGGKVLKVGAAVGAVKEVGQIVSGQAEKDFRRIQALENRIAVAKGQKPKYTRSGSNRNLLESAKVDVGNALSWIGVGKSRKERLQELKLELKKTEAKKPPVKTPAKSAGKTPTVTTPGGQKVGGTPKATTSGTKYRVTSGDTLSGIAARAGVSLKELRAANPQITDPRKIYRNTGVVIPKGGKVPTGGYSKKAK